MRGRKLLLKKATRGISVGKWNGPGGKVERGETPEAGAAREVFEETGLRVSNLFHHGTILFCMDGGRSLGIRVHLFSTSHFAGRVRSTEEGMVRWFPVDGLPWGEMWDDDRYWFPVMLSRGTFDARFYYDGENRKVVEYEIHANNLR
jgi:8-oxo-dGTP pyrophosphatase MutT (NUDIX family)